MFPGGSRFGGFRRFTFTTQKWGSIMKPFLCFILLMASFVLVGCGSGADAVKLVPVSGTVKTSDGTPLSDAVVTFQPQTNEMTAPSSSGKTNAEGKFTLQTAIGEAGAIPGNHLVRISLAAGDDSDAGGSSQEKIVEKYNSKSTTEFAVPDGGSDAADFKVELNK